MTNLLLDTNAVITLAQAPPGTSFPGLRDGDAAAISIVTEMEVRGGLAANPADDERQQTLSFLTGHYVPLPVDARVAFHYHRVATATVVQGQEPRKRFADLVIAATALAHGATLVTDDQALARAVSGLLPVRPLT
ncbi:type II toxin-antitoxin system VapC family toxin [Kineococcus sp. G2]|uniref:type II toxin-antitoxin system VapC family toxin n=1 Tax=Kineococcus sp. G2 TaxID=3127484 RepID=UPI00301D7656